MKDDHFAKENEAVQFAEWIDKNRYSGIHSPSYKNSLWCDESEYEWNGEKERLIATSELHTLFQCNKQK